MEVRVLIALVVYVVVGWFLADSCTDEKESTRMTVLITWPLFLVMTVGVLACGIVIGLVDVLMKLMYREDLSNGTE